MKNREIEFKYKAAITLSEFKTYCDNKQPHKFIIVSGYDHFYTNSDNPTSFYRHRVNTNENQLTFKKKIEDDNNYIRIEHNVDLPLSVSEEKIKDLCNINGYIYDFTLFKNCFIYNYDYYTLVYYIVYNTDLNELGRFIEIEMKEDFNWVDDNEAMTSLVTLEKLSKPLAISTSHRVKESLYEMFRGIK